MSTPFPSRASMRKVLMLVLRNDADLTASPCYSDGPGRKNLSRMGRASGNSGYGGIAWTWLYISNNLQ